jgi:hypothetical protein
VIDAIAHFRGVGSRPWSLPCLPAKGTGVDESILMRFVWGEMSIRLDKADRLAAYLGLRLTPDPDAKPPEPTPENLARPTLAKRKAKRKAN